MVYVGGGSSDLPEDMRELIDGWMGQIDKWVDSGTEFQDDRHIDSGRGDGGVGMGTGGGLRNGRLRRKSRAGKKPMAREVNIMRREPLDVRAEKKEKEKMGLWRRCVTA